MFTLSQGILMLGDGMSLVFGMVDRAIFFLFEVFESGQFDGYSFVGVEFFVFFLVHEELAFEVSQKVSMVLCGKGVAFPCLKSRVFFLVISHRKWLLKGRFLDILCVFEHQAGLRPVGLC